MLKFFCSICIEDVELHPESMDMSDAIAHCPSCQSEIQTTYAKPENPKKEDLSIENYNVINGLDTNTP
jgi:DNA-directed RNA polymerase subunit RPC12/RpoP